MASLHFWISSFIPRDVPNYTHKIPKGQHGGKTAIPLPELARFHGTNAIKRINTGYLTDQRSFSSKIAASVRMISHAQFDVTDGRLTLVGSRHKSSGTTEVDMKTGEQLGFAYANMSRCSFKVLHVEPHYMKLRLTAAAGDPLVAAAADIDYKGILEVYATGPKVAFDGKIDEFPAYESYAKFNLKRLPLFKVPPPPGNTVTDLLGSANRQVIGSAKF